MKSNLTLKLVDGTFAMRALELKGAAPTEFQLVPCGTWDGYLDGDQKKRSFTVSRSDIAAAVAYHQERKRTNPGRDLVVDYEHQTLTGEKAPAAGWIGDLEDRADNGLWATNVRWTDEAKRMIEKGEYRYVSPVFKHNAIDKKRGGKVAMAVFNAALTNEPFFDELAPLVAKDNTQLYVFQSHNHKEDTMNPLMQFLVSFFALAAGTTEDAVVAKSKEYFGKFKDFGIALKDESALTADNVFTQLKAKFDELSKFKENYSVVAKALGQSETALPEALTALITAKGDMSSYVPKADFLALKARLDEREVDELILAAMSKGKISPATRDSMRALALKDRSAFTDIIAKMPEYSVVPVQQIQTPDVGSRTSEVTEMDLVVAKVLGKDGDDKYLAALKATK